MKKQMVKIVSLAMALAMSMCLLAALPAIASDINSGAKLLRAEYQGVELSRDMQNPTVLDYAGDDVFIELIGNSACATLIDANVFLSFEGGGSPTGGSSRHIDASGRSGWWLNNASRMYVGNDVFEVYWHIFCVTETNGDTSTMEIIPNSQTPTYYITFNQGKFDHEVPYGAEPAIVRAELNNSELSTDKDRPTIIPYHNQIKLVGNSACASKTLVVHYWHHKMWSTGGQVVYFNSSALASCSLGVAYEYEGNNGRPLYNETVEVEFSVDNLDYDAMTMVKSPVYYVIYLDEDSSMIDFGLNGLFQTVRLTGEQLIVEAKQGYIFDGSNMILKDKTENVEYKLGIWADNPDCSGVNTDRIVYKKLPLKMQNVYELTIPARAVYYKTGADPNDYNNFKYNREYKTELILEGALTFTDVEDGYWAYPYVTELTEKRVMNGYLDGTFKPSGQVTRSEFAKMMTLALQIPLLASTGPSFADVGMDDWEFVYVETAKKYLTGYKLEESYYFKGKEPAVREDMAVALVKAMQLENQQVDVSELQNIFSDHDTISANLQKYVLIAYKNYLISGYPDGTFGAQKSITRAEAASLLVKVIKSAAMEKVVFDDDRTDENPANDNPSSLAVENKTSTVQPYSLLKSDNLDLALILVYKEQDSYAQLTEGQGGMGFPGDVTFVVFSSYSTNSEWVVRISRGEKFIAQKQFQMSANNLVIGDTCNYTDANFSFTIADFALTDQQKMLIEQLPMANGNLEWLCFAIYPADKSFPQRLFYIESLKLNY